MNERKQPNPPRLYDAVMYEPGGRDHALSRVRRMKNPAAAGLRFGLTFHFGWRRQGRPVTGVTTAEPPFDAPRAPSDYRWTPAGKNVLLGVRKETAAGADRERKKGADDDGRGEEETAERR